jgi:sulfotransferase
MSIHFVSGFPRSGSTLLMNLLGQHPEHHVTPTNGLISLVEATRSNWGSEQSFQAQGLQTVAPRIPGVLRGIMSGFYEKELSAGKTVFDKSRGWITKIDLLEELLQRRVHIIYPVRDVRAIAASFEKLFRKSPLDRPAFLGPAYNKAQTTEGRAQILFSEGGMAGSAIRKYHEALQRGYGDRLVVVPYRMLTTEPLKTMNYIHSRIGRPQYPYDPNHVTQITKEDDALYGWGFDLHTIRPKIEPAAEAPWEGILPASTCQNLAQSFADINALAASTFEPR